MSEIQSFSITGLHNKSRTISITFTDNILILVGENGSGKTTILQCFFYTLTQQWSELLKFHFSYISLTINNKIFKIDYEDIEKFIIKSSRRFSYLPPHITRRLNLALSKNIPLSLRDLEQYAEVFNIPLPILIDAQKDFLRNGGGSSQIKIFHEIKEYIDDKLNFWILYLPTYRRIEQELSSIFKGVDDSDIRKFNSRRFHIDNTYFLEMVEFGMKDVAKYIDDTLSTLNNFARENLNSLTSTYFADIIDKKYYNQDSISFIKKLSKNSIDSALARIDTNVLSDINKDKLRETISKLDIYSSGLSEHEKIICHYFVKLINFQNELHKKEQNILNFCNVCNKYLVNKEISYNQQQFRLEIVCKNSYYYKNDSNDIHLQNLSSGEKQIVSIFSHLFLSNHDKYFIIIDEPELSLSVEWQKNILVDIYESATCGGIFAVTHSPFIFDNKLMPYAKGIGSLGSYNA